MIKEELIEILLNDGEYSERELLDMTDFELFNAWLVWEGIIGYSEEIWDTVKLLGDE